MASNYHYFFTFCLTRRDSAREFRLWLQFLFSPSLAVAVPLHPNVVRHIFGYLLAIAEVPLLVTADDELDLVIKSSYFTLVLFVAINYECIGSLI